MHQYLNKSLSKILLHGFIFNLFFKPQPFFLPNMALWTGFPNVTLWPMTLTQIGSMTLTLTHLCCGDSPIPRARLGQGSGCHAPGGSSGSLPPVLRWPAANSEGIRHQALHCIHRLLTQLTGHWPDSLAHPSKSLIHNFSNSNLKPKSIYLV